MQIFVVQRIDIEFSRARIAFLTRSAAAQWIDDTIAINRKFNRENPELVARTTCHDSFAIIPVELCD